MRLFTTTGNKTTVTEINLEDGTTSDRLVFPALEWKDEAASNNHTWLIKFLAWLAYNAIRTDMEVRGTFSDKIVDLLADGIFPFVIFSRR